MYSVSPKVKHHQSNVLPMFIKMNAEVSNIISKQITTMIDDNVADQEMYLCREFICETVRLVQCQLLVPLW